MSARKMIGANIRSKPGGFAGVHHRKQATYVAVANAAKQWLASRGIAGRATEFDRAQANTHNPR